MLPDWKTTEPAKAKMPAGMTRPLGMWALALGAVGVFAASVGLARGLGLVSESEGFTAVSSRVYNGYERTRAADGSVRPETYAMGIGGRVDTSVSGLQTPVSGVVRDVTIDGVGFGTIATSIEGPLAEQAYLPTTSAEKTDLVIMVYWGRTFATPPPGQMMDGPSRDLIDLRNAALLGFDRESVLDPQGFSDPTNIMAHIKREVHTDVMSALEVDRYFVVLRAFDFQEAWKRKKIRLLWETRFSLSERRHDFGRELPKMVEVASKYFGQDTRGLIQKPPPEGRVEIGVPQAIDTGSEK
jgi:hypothetical protein